MKSEAEIRAALAEMHDWADTRLVEAEDRNGEREIPKAPTPDYHYGYDAGMAEVFRCVSNRLENIIKGGDAACLTRTTRSNQDLSTDRGPHPVEKHAHIRSLAAQPVLSPEVVASIEQGRADARAGNARSIEEIRASLVQPPATVDAEPIPCICGTIFCIHGPCLAATHRVFKESMSVEAGFKSHPAYAGYRAKAAALLSDEGTRK